MAIGTSTTVYLHDQPSNRIPRLTKPQGSFGTYPIPIRTTLRRFQDEAEAKPDHYIRYANPVYLDAARSAIATHLHAPTPTCVFVPNATTGMNTVLRSLVFHPKDTIIYFATIYGACEKTISYIQETTPAQSHKITYTYPISDAKLCSLFETAVADVKAQGLNPKLAIYDTIVSMPGVRMPFEKLTALCKKHGILSCIDGAHGVGHIPLNLSRLDPDFFFSNCHKWLHVPRGCAVFYTPERNQHLIRSTLPTSWGFVPKSGEVAVSPLPVPEGKSAFVALFEYMATVDNSAYLCVPAALAWREKVTWGDLSGEEAVMGYGAWVVREGAKLVAEVLGTEVMENEDGTLGKCQLANVRLPLEFGELAGGDVAKAGRIAQWMFKVQGEEYGVVTPMLVYAEAWWVRLSGQIYLTLEDFEVAAKGLKEICERAKAGEWER